MNLFVNNIKWLIYLFLNLMFRIYFFRKKVCEMFGYKKYDVYFNLIYVKNVI